MDVVIRMKLTGCVGGIITSYCSEFENLDNAGHGVKIETVCMVVCPYLFVSDPGALTNTHSLMRSSRRRLSQAASRHACRLSTSAT